MTFNILVEETNQTFPIPEEIGKDDNMIKRALAGVVPYIDTAKLERKEENGVTTIKVIKSHAPKGNGAGIPGSTLSSVVEHLANGNTDGENPVASLYRQLVKKGVKVETLKPAESLALSSIIKETLAKGDELHHRVTKTLQYLLESSPVEAKNIPIGF